MHMHPPNEVLNVKWYFAIMSCLCPSPTNHQITSV